MKLTEVERWIVSNQLRILESLYPDQAEDLARQRDALESGYELEYGNGANISTSTLSDDACDEVYKILLMHVQLAHAYETLEDKSGIDPSDIQFKGWDGNNESKQRNYSLFLDPDGTMYPELKGQLKVNTHTPTLNRYRTMLAVWKATRSPSELTRDDIQAIVGAWKQKLVGS